MVADSDLIVAFIRYCYYVGNVIVADWRRTRTALARYLLKFV